MILAERIYASVLGKLIGVYAGRPVEGWSSARIEAEHGEIHGYLGPHRIVADDDLSGTFGFVRALAQHGYDPQLTSRQIGETWLNELVEGRTTLWWGGMGRSAEHTAYLRLISGVPAPDSGSIERNGPVVAQQIGAQIFIEGWALLWPGDPAAAADWAERAARVSHDGEAVWGARVVAALVASALVDDPPPVRDWIETVTRFAPEGSEVRACIEALLDWHAEGIGWREAIARVQALYPYARFGGVCPLVSNHALIHVALLWSGDDFDQALRLAVNAGWDTDCNAANVGCAMAARLGLAGIPEKWRDPIRDRLYVVTADGGACHTDAETETWRLLDTASRLRGETPKPRWRWPLSFSGSTHGLIPLDRRVPEEGMVIRATEPPEDYPNGYGWQACPRIYPGQVLRAHVRGAEPSWRGTFASGEPDWVVESAEAKVPSGGLVEDVTLVAPGAEVIGLDAAGLPEIVWPNRVIPGARLAWVNAVTEWVDVDEPFLLRQDRGVGLLIHGQREWTDLRAEATVSWDLASRVGMALRCGGLRRWLGLLVGLRVEVVLAWDGVEVLLAESPWDGGHAARLELAVRGNWVRGAVGPALLEAALPNGLAQSGSFAWIVEEGAAKFGSLRIRPA